MHTFITKPKGGRPRSQTYEKKNYNYSARFSAMDATLVDANIRRSGMSRADYIRNALKHPVIYARLPRQVIWWLKDIAGIANNVNQLAKQANAGGYFSVHQSLSGLAEKISNLVGYIYNYPTKVSEKDSNIEDL